MKSNPLHYDGVVPQDDDDLSFSESRSVHRSSFNISSTGNRIPGNRDSSMIQWLDNITLDNILFSFAYIIIFILSIIAVVYLSSINQSLKSSNNCTTSVFSMNELTLIPNDDSKSTGFKAYTDTNKSKLYWRIPSTIVDNNIDILLVEQLTSGLGIRELFLDAGSVISQDIAEFRKLGLNQLDLVLLQQSYRSDNTELIEKSYSVPVLWSFDIVNINSDGYLIQLNDFILSIEIGYIHGKTIPTILSSIYGIKYTYILDSHRSTMNIDTSHTNTYRGYINRQFTYYLTAQTTLPPANIGKQFSISSRLTFLLLDKYTELCSLHAGQQTYSSDHPRLYLPMSSFNYISYMNESAELLQARQEVYITRHRLYNMTSSSSSGSSSSSSIGSSSSSSSSSGSTTSRGSTSTTSSTAIISSTAAAGSNNNIRIKKTMENKYHSSSDSSSRSSDSSDSTSTIQDHTQLIYYIDTSTPTYIRDALISGINWWDEAFQQAGYPAGTIIATTAPKNLDPYDFTIPKFNYVEYINRNYRSYSLGIRIINPKTGEILKGHVRIENLRMKQDALIAEVLLGPFQEETDSSSGSTTAAGITTTDIISKLQSYNKQHNLIEQQPHKTEEIIINNKERTPSTTATTTAATNPLQEDIIATIIQRVSQLGAHEVGHTLGLAHNYAGSTARKGYSSVMDYPPPMVTIEQNTNNNDNKMEDILVLNTESYSDKIGIYDKIAISYGYSAVNMNFTNKSQEYEYLNNLLQYAIVHDEYTYLTDEDSSVDSADWHGTQWDSGNNPILSLNYSLKIRYLGLKKLENRVNVVEMYTAYSKMQELLPLVYLWHRYEVVAVSKLLGGYLYQYSVRDTSTSSSTSSGSDRMVEYIPGSLQLAALDQVQCYINYITLYTLTYGLRTILRFLNI